MAPADLRDHRVAQRGVAENERDDADREGPKRPASTKMSRHGSQRSADRQGRHACCPPDTRSVDRARHRGNGPRCAWGRTPAHETLRTRGQGAAQTGDRASIEPRWEFCRGAGRANEKLRELHAQVLHHRAQVVDDRTHLVDDRIHPWARSLQHRTRRIGDDADALDEGTRVFGRMRSGGGVRKRFSRCVHSAD
jgi:hypothetical protein